MKACRIMFEGHSACGGFEALTTPQPDGEIAMAVVVRLLSADGASPTRALLNDTIGNDLSARNLQNGPLGNGPPIDSVHKNARESA